MSREQFWASTPFELSQDVKAHRDKIQLNWEMVKSLAWTTAGLSRVEKLPNYEKWMAGESENKPLSEEEIESMKQERDAIMSEIREARANARTGNSSHGN